MPIAEAYGGTGASCLDLIVFLEEFARIFEAGANIYYTTTVIGADMLTHFGSEEQKRKLLPKLAKGEIRFAFSVTEPDSGSDAAALRTRAQLDGDHWVINGQKMFLLLRAGGRLHFVAGSYRCSKAGGHYDVPARSTNARG